MPKENEPIKYLIYGAEIGLLLLALITLSGAAFSQPTREIIFKRDNGKCVCCGKSFTDGWLVDCAHLNHDHTNSLYDHPATGVLKCLECHSMDHKDDPNIQGLFRKRIAESKGGHTRRWIERNCK